MIFSVEHSGLTAAGGAADGDEEGHGDGEEDGVAKHVAGELDEQDEGGAEDAVLAEFRGEGVGGPEHEDYG